MWQKKIFVSVAILVLALMVAFPAAGLVAGESSTDTTNLSTTKSSILEAYGNLPLLFIENQGQVDEAARYYVTSSGQTVYFTEENIVFDLIHYDQAEANDTADRQAERLVFSLDFLGANIQPAIEGSGKDGAVVNYFIGNDPEQWHANVPIYRELVYRDIYPNIDLRLYGDGGMLRYDFIVNPGATPETIALAYNGIDSLAIIDGELVISTAFGDMVQSQPYIYQQIGDKVVEVEGGFRLDSDNTYGFHVAAYNNRYPLIIDPTMEIGYSTYLGGTGDDYVSGIAVDTGGCAYVTGYTTSADFPWTPGAYDTSWNGSFDAFVTKLSQAGSALVYSTCLGGTGVDEGCGIAVDTGGFAYVTGITCSADFPWTPGAYDTSWNGGYDAFVTKLSPAGSALVYSTYLGGTDDDDGSGIAVDTGGCAYVTGITYSADFPTTPGAFQVAFAGVYYDAFVTKIEEIYSPYTPSDPSPRDGATDVSINADLSWTGGDPDAGDTVTYDVYFGASSSPPLVSDNQGGTSYDPGTLAYNTRYYWQIVATDNHGASTTGPLWDFTTQMAPGLTVTWNLPWGLDADPAAVNIWVYPDQGVEVALADVEATMPNGLLIWYYGGPTEGWRFYKKGWGSVNTLDTLTPGKGYIGIVPTAAVWEIPQG